VSNKKAADLLTGGRSFYASRHFPLLNISIASSLFLA